LTKKLERPARTIRFVFPPEIEGTLALLNGKGQYATLSASTEPGKTTIRVADSFLNGPDLTKRIKAVIHMDMVGGGPETKAVFHVTRGPMSLPSFVHDVAWAFADWVNEESYKFCGDGESGLSDGCAGRRERAAAGGVFGVHIGQRPQCV